MPSDQPIPRALCFVAMPFGKKAAPGREERVIDFDNVYEHIKRAVEGRHMECIRADYEAAGGFVHRHMFERLLVAEYVIADLSLSNPNVAYEVGVRHGASAGTTLLVCADETIANLPFDFRPFRVLTYHLEAEGTLSAAEAEQFERSIAQRLAQALGGSLPVDNPLMQLTAWSPADGIEHAKTDVFIERMAYVNDIGKRIRELIQVYDGADAIERLGAIEQKLLSSPEVVPQLHTSLMALFLGYREKQGYDRMIALYEKLPGELQQTPVAREQAALALNRRAEHAAKMAADEEDETTRKALFDEADQHRKRALLLLDEIPKRGITSETHGIRGRIYKGWYDADRARGQPTLAEAHLKNAIETYEQGFRTDPRDYYPGVNAITLRLSRASEEDKAKVEALAPVVRFAVECVPAPKDDMERYWQVATKLELASAARDWPAAKEHLLTLLGVPAQGWMRETTAKNLKIQQRAFAEDPDAVAHLSEFQSALLTG
jgi:hypothetical protein